MREVVLCEQCDAFLVTEEDNKGAKAFKNTWPSFVWSVLKKFINFEYLWNFRMETDANRMTLLVT